MNKFCIVGLGEHAKKKMIPAIRNLKNVNIAAVTSTFDFKENDVLKFDTVDQAISKLDKDLHPKQSTKTILWLSLMLQITMALLIIYDMTVGF